MRAPVASLALLSLAFTVAAHAQVPCDTSPIVDTYCKRLQNYYDAARRLKQPGLSAQDTDDAKKAMTRNNIIDFGSSADLFLAATQPTLPDLANNAKAVALSNLGDAAQLLDQNRLDRSGASTGSAATGTDLTSRPGVTELVSAALSIGGLTQTTSGNTVTLHANAGGVRDYLQYGQVLFVEDAAGQPQPSSDKCGVKASNGKPAPIKCWWDLRNLDVGVSFVVGSPTSTTTAATTGSANSATPSIASILLPGTQHQWTGISARYSLAAPFDPASKEFHQAWQQAYAKNQQALADAAKALGAALEDADTVFQSDEEIKLAKDFKAKLDTDITNNDPKAFAKDFNAYALAMFAAERAVNPKFDEALAAARIAQANFKAVNQAAVRDAMDLAQTKWPFTVEYNYNQPLNQPATHNAKLILSKQSGAALYTLNGAATIYHGQLPPGAAYHRFRDVQFSAEVDRGFGKNNEFLVTGSFYYQYQQDPTILNITSANLVPGTSITLPDNAQVLLGTSGSTVIGQIKGTVNLHSGLKIPFAFKWANKTDLLDTQDKVGQFGISYDFSSFSSLLGRSSTATTP